MRMAILGSPGLGAPMRTPFRVSTVLGLTPNTTAQAIKTGAGATYAAVPAGNHLDLNLNGIPGLVVVTFTGAENSQATFHAAINAVLNLLGTPLPFGAPAGAVNVGGQTQLIAPFFGSISGGSVAASTSAAVIASLGQAAGAFTAPTNGVQTYAGLYARQMGGMLVAGAAFRQRFLPVRRGGMGAALLMLDRGVAAATLSDNPRYGPAYA